MRRSAMKSTVVKLVYFCVGLAVVPFVQSLECADIRAYNYLNDFVHHDKCESVDLVFKYLHDMTEQKGDGMCRRDIINKLANLFGIHPHTPDYCQCSGTFQLQSYSRTPNDGISSDLADTCLRNQAAYRELYNQFFTSNAHPQGLHCRTHHSLWTQLRDIGDSQCQKDIVYHISYAFSQHGDPCTCSERYVAATSSPNQHGQGQTDHCYQYPSYTELDSLLQHSKCMSANTVWHLLNNLQHKDSGCRKDIQNRLAQSYHNVSTNGNNHCVCTHTRELTNKQHLHLLDNGIYPICSQERGSTYSDIERDLFTHIKEHGCRNHNYLWPKLAGVKDHCEGHNCQTRHIDCTTDLIVRAAFDYPSQESDSCVCSSPHATESLSTTTTTTTTTDTKTPQHTTTPTTTIKSDVITTTPHATTTTTTTATTTPQHTTTPTTTIKSDVTTTTQHMCNKYEAIEDIAKSIHVTHPDATPCNSNDEGSDDAYTIVTCNMAPPRTWTKGTNVMSTCSAGLNSLPTYIPIATFGPERSNFLPEGSQSGIFLGCDGNGIKMAVQKCNGVPTIIHVANGTFVNNPDNYYTIA